MLVALSSRGRRQGRRVFRRAGARAGEGRAWSPLIHGRGVLSGGRAGGGACAGAADYRDVSQFYKV